MKLSVIIPAYNHLENVLRCLTAVRDTTNPANTEVLVQDDCSPDVNLPPLLGACCQRNATNLGFPGNCNAGARRARGDVLLFLNQDCWPIGASWDRRLLDFFELQPEAGIAGPTLLFPDGRVQSVGGEFDAACQPFHTALGAQNPDWEPIARPRQVPWITGAALAVRRATWQRLGGFDEGYGRSYFEDVALCCAAREAGWQVWHRPNIRFYHGVGSTGGNPDMLKNAMRFREQWVNTGKVKPDTHFIMTHFWA